MPSTSAKQHRFMEAVAHSPSFAKKAGVSQSVGKDFSAADKGRKFEKGGATMMIKKVPMKSSSKGGMPPAMMASMMARKRPAMGEAPLDSMAMKKGGMAMKDGKPAFMKKFAEGGVTESSDDAKYLKKKKDSSAEMAQLAREIGRKEGAERQNTAAGRGGVLGTPTAYVERAGQYIGDKFDDADAYLSEKMGMQDRATFKKGVRQGLKDEGYKKGGMAKYAKGGGIESHGKTKGTIIRMASGGSVSSRADGIAQRGKTRG